MNVDTTGIERDVVPGQKYLISADEDNITITEQRKGTTYSAITNGNITNGESKEIRFSGSKIKIVADTSEAWVLVVATD